MKARPVQPAGQGETSDAPLPASSISEDGIEGVVDCLSEVLGIGGFEAVLSQSIQVELPFGSCRILDIDGLMRAKEAMNRDHDRITVRQLQEIKKRQSSS